MKYEPDFVKSFMCRTVEIIETYGGPLDATILVNCLLGLLIVPKEVLFDTLPDVSGTSLGDWGIDTPSFNTGKLSNGTQPPLSLKLIVHRMRNAVAHFRIDPIEANGVVQGFIFADKNGFRGSFSLSSLRTFVIKLAQHLLDARVAP